MASSAQAQDGGPDPGLCPSQALLFVYNQPQAVGVALEFIFRPHNEPSPDLSSLPSR